MKYKADFELDHPDFFYPFGITVFCGKQGSGKSMSAIHYMQDLARRFPKCIFVSNTPYADDFSWLDPKRFHQYFGDKSFTTYKNGEYGIVFFLDEIHLEFNSLESKKMSLQMFVQISQQRKQRIHIVGTAQVFTRLSKAFREQCDQIILCNNVLGLDILNINSVCDGDSIKDRPDGTMSVTVRKKYYLIHGPALYGAYNSFNVVDRIGRPDESEVKGVILDGENGD